MVWDAEQWPFRPPMFIRKWLFEQKLKQFTPAIPLAPPSNRLGPQGAWLVIFDGKDPWQAELAKYIAQYRRPDYFCQTLGLVRHNQADLNSFHPQELTHALLPPDRILSLARSRPFDLCINLSSVSNPPLEYLVLVANAPTKIGVNRQSSSPRYNLELGLKLAGAKPSLRSLLQHLAGLGLHTIQHSKLQSIHPLPTP